jgi:hypothetical protein
VEDGSDRWVQPDRWDPRVSERKRKGAVPVRVGLAGRGLFLLAGPKGSRGPFLVFISSLLFLFLFSELNPIFCKTPSNQFKLLSKIF